VRPSRIWSAGWPPLAPGDTSDTADTLRNALARAQEAAERLAGAWDTAAGAIADFAQPFLHGTVFTHSRSGTVERVLVALAQQPGKLVGALVTESRPGGEGVATARALAAAGLHVTLVADAAVGLMASEATCVVLGADSIRS
jgi:translation initiation factor 2B subunit (eIF-2B alpha/beta/delta family)